MRSKIFNVNKFSVLTLFFLKKSVREKLYPHQKMSINYTPNFQYINFKTFFKESLSFRYVGDNHLTISHIEVIDNKIDIITHMKIYLKNQTSDVYLWKVRSSR